MITPVHLAEILPVDVRVDLRRCDVCVPQHLLNGAQVGATFEEMCGERMPERVWRDVLLDTSAVDVAAEDFPCAHARQRTSARIEKEHALALALLELRAQLTDVDR